METRKGENRIMFIECKYGVYKNGHYLGSEKMAINVSEIQRVLRLPEDENSCKIILKDGKSIWVMQTYEAIIRQIVNASIEDE